MAPAAANGLAAEGAIEDESAEEMGGGAGVEGFNAAKGLAAAGAAVFCLAMSANAFKILEVSGAAEVGAGC